MQAEQLGRRLTENNVILVVGGSGSGKSSLVKAGLLPNLKTIAPAPGRLGKWYVADCRPRTDPAAQVSEALWQQICEPLLADTVGREAAALGFGIVADSQQPRPLIEEACKEKFRTLVTRPGTSGRRPILDSYGVHEFANAVLDRIDDHLLEGLRAGSPNLLLLIDQFEEIFDDDRINPEERDSIFALIDLARRNRGQALFVVLTMRSEALHRCAEDPRLVDVVNQSSFLLELIDERDVTDAIVSPARVALQAWAIIPTEARPAGDTRPFTPTLVDALAGELMRLRTSLVHKPDSLPLLQHTLEAIWDEALQRLDTALREDRDLTAFHITEDDFCAIAGQKWDSQGPFRQCLNLRADACLADSKKILTERRGISSETAERILAAVFSTLARRDDRGNWVREFATAADMLASSGAAQAHQVTEADIVETLRPFVSAAFLQAERKADTDLAHRGAANSSDVAGIEYNVGHEALIRSWSRCEQWLHKAERLSELLRNLDNSLSHRSIEDEAVATTGGTREPFRLRDSSGSLVGWDWLRTNSGATWRWVWAKSEAAWRWITAKNEEDAARLVSPQQASQLQDLFGIEPLYAKQWTLDRLVEHRREVIRRQQGGNEIAPPVSDGADEAIAKERLDEIVQVVDDADQWRTGSWTRVPGWARLQTILATAVVVIGAVMASAYYIAEKQRLLASSNFELAVANFKLAVTSSQSLLNQVSESLNRGDITVKGAQDMLQVARNNVHEYKVETREIIRLLAKLYWTESDINATLQNQTEEYETAKEARDLVEPLSLANPDDTELLPLLYNSIWRMGDAVADRGGRPSALQALELYQEAEKLARRLATMAPENGARQRRIAFIVQKIGDCYQILEEWSKAIEIYRQAASIMRGILAKSPANRDWQRELANTLSRSGQALAGKGDFDAAMEEYNAALKIRGDLGNEDKTDGVLQSNQAISHRDIANLYAKRGDLDKALDEYKIAIGIWEGLNNRDPGNANWQLYLAPIYANASAVLKRNGKLMEAVGYSRKAYEIRRELAHRDPTNQVRQHAFATSAMSLGELMVSRNQSGDADEAVSLYRAAIETLDDLRPRYDLDVFSCYLKIGDILKSENHPEAALKEYERAASIARESAIRDPASKSWQRNVTRSFRTITDLLLAQGRMQEALEHNQNALKFVEQVAATITDDAQWSTLVQSLKTEITKLTAQP
jgi:tetratricopeptide (TPR) repeat protein